MPKLYSRFIKRYGLLIFSITNNIKLILILALLISLNICYAQSSINNYSFNYQNDYYYLTDANGKIMESIELFTYAEPFSEGLALVEKNLKFGFIDTTGNLILDYQFIDAGSFSNGLAYASVDTWRNQRQTH